jgi:hypothetical protein
MEGDRWFVVHFPFLFGLTDNALEHFLGIAVTCLLRAYGRGLISGHEFGPPSRPASGWHGECPTTIAGAM